MKTLFISIFIFLVLLVATFVMSSKADNLKGLKMFINWVNPPKDYYNYLVNENLDINKVGSKTSYNFSNKYEGKYFVGFLISNFNKTWTSSSVKALFKAAFKVSFCYNNKLILTKEIRSEYDPFIGVSDNGFICMNYEVPQDIPLNKLVTCEIEILHGDSDFVKLHNPIHFFIKKAADE